MSAAAPQPDREREYPPAPYRQEHPEELLFWRLFHEAAAEMVAERDREMEERRRATLH